MSDAVTAADGEVLVTAVAGNGRERSVIVSLYRRLLVIHNALPSAVYLFHTEAHVGALCGMTRCHLNPLRVALTPQGTPHSQQQQQHLFRRAGSKID